LGGPVPEGPEDPVVTVDRLVAGASPGIVRGPGPRYFGFVTGGAVPAALAADVLTSGWDQNTAFAVMSPAAATIEQIAGEWVLELLGLPASAGFALVTGAQMANVTCLLAARHHVLSAAGWDDAAHGLIGARPIRVIVGDEAHVTVHVALRYIGLGAPTVVIPSDDQGRMRSDVLTDALTGDRVPTIVCAQSGNVNTGASDPMGPIADACRAAGAWMHVDGAFGLWAAAAPARRHLVAGVERADSWATDGHKWLNVPYDCGIAMTAHPDVHRRAMSMTAAYLVAGDGLRDGSDWAPESSRRARGFAVWAAIRSLGRSGLADLVERCCALADRMARQLAAVPGVEILNDVVLNQALARFTPPDGGDADAFTRAVIQRVQEDGVCWAGGTVWQGKQAMRISISNWSTTQADADRSVEAILAAAAAVAAPIAGTGP
jgi:glutamate/tyrosine decarboxylase-like PLP-dependent enzyme